MKIAQRLMLAAGLLLVCATASWGQVPVITSPTNVTGLAGVTNFSYQITTKTPDTTTTFTTSVLPAGLMLFQTTGLNGSTIGLITGTLAPQTAGTTNFITLSASNGSGVGVPVTLTLIVLSPPLITSPATASAIAKQQFNYQIRVTNLNNNAINAITFDASPLPAGLARDVGTGLISGIPTSPTLTPMNVTLSVSVSGVVYPAPGSIAATTNLALTIQPSSVGKTTNVVFTEGFESNFPAGWQVGDDAGIPVYWTAVQSPFGGVTAPDGNAMAYCAGFGYGGTSDHPTYQKRMASYMQRTFDLSAFSLITLQFSSYIPSIEQNFDFCRVLVSGNGGPWANVWKVSRVDSAWTSEFVPLNNYAGMTSVTVRFEFDSIRLPPREGWFLDDIMLSTAQGDRFDNATPIPSGTNYAGSVETPGAVDVTSVPMRAGYTYVITATPGSLTDPQMWLFGTIGTNRVQLAYNKHYKHRLLAQITYNCTNSTTYFVQVGGVNKRYSGSYTLLVTELPVYADIRAVSVAMTITNGEPRTTHPLSLSYILQNNGPFDLGNGVTNLYRVEVFLSTSSVNPEGGASIGSENITLTTSNGASTNIDNSGDVNMLASYTIPVSLAAGTNYVWLHVTPVSGSPTDPVAANNWVVGANTVYLPPPTNVFISGFVTNDLGVGKTGVVMRLSPSGVSTNAVVTDSNGNYNVNVSIGWIGTITPLTNGFGGGFYPASSTYTSLTASLVSQNFFWTTNVFISGFVTNDLGVGKTGVVLRLSPSGLTTNAVVTDSNGNYSVNVSIGWSGTIAPSTNGFGGGFYPASNTYTTLIASLVSQNFTWTTNTVYLPPPTNVFISGFVTNDLGFGKTGVVMQLSPSGVSTNAVVTDTNGNYSVNVSIGWSGTITPSTNGFGGGFYPASSTYTTLIASLVSQNFTWTTNTVYLPPPTNVFISGFVTNDLGVGKTGVVLRLSPSGLTTNAVVTDSNGNYSVNVSIGWSGTITPLTNGFGGGFYPASSTYTTLIASLVSQNFAWTTNTNPQGNARLATKTSNPIARPVVTQSVDSYRTSEGADTIMIRAVATSLLDIPSAPAVPSVAPPLQLLHTSGTANWHGRNVVLVRQSPKLLTITLMDGEVKVDPVVPVAGPNDMNMALDFANGIGGMLGTPACELAIVRNLNGQVATFTTLNGITILDNVQFSMSGTDAVLTWDITLLRQ